jgi:hypothetical protein
MRIPEVSVILIYPMTHESICKGERDPEAPIRAGFGLRIRGPQGRAGGSRSTAETATAIHALDTNGRTFGIGYHAGRIRPIPIKATLPGGLA